MSYKILILPDGTSEPVIVCDHCDKTIDKGHEGNALWLETLSDGRTQRRYYDVQHTHKACNLAFDAGNPPEHDQHWMSRELRVDLLRLLHNVK
jgi:hypothetical protein